MSKTYGKRFPQHPASPRFRAACFPFPSYGFGNCAPLSVGGEFEFVGCDYLSNLVLWDVPTARGGAVENPNPEGAELREQNM